MKKYEFTGETIKIFGRTLYRIRALIRIETGAFSIEPGELGGWIEKENNLSHKGDAWVCGNARVYGDALVYGNAQVCGNARVYGDALVYGNAQVCGNAQVYGDALVYGNAQVCGNAGVCGDAEVKKKNHIMTIGPIGSRNDTTTFFRTKEKLIKVKCGYFVGTIEKFLGKVVETHGINKHANVYRIAAELAIAQIEVDDE